MSDSGMVIIGAGKAAASAIVSLREHKWTGSITLIGEEQHAPYDRPSLSKSAITGEEEPEPVFILDARLLNSLGVTFIAGTAAIGIDRIERM
jgi:3-phenylpropionate/trans-cinnamate dioxygenase ferredoxin reductase component